MAASSATQASTPRDFQRNDVVRDTSRPEQPPGVVLSVNGGTVTFRLPKQSRGATRVVKAKVADVEVAPPTTAAGHGTTPATPAAAHAPGEAAKPFRHGDRAVVQEGGVTRPVRIVKVGGRTATVVFTDQPAVPGGAGKVDVRRLQRPEAAAEASGPPPLPTGEAAMKATGAKPVGQADAAYVEPAHGQRVPRATMETAADLLALRTKQQVPSGPATEAALREAVGTPRFRDANRLLGTTEGRATAEAALATRKELTARNAPLPGQTLDAQSTAQRTDRGPQTPSVLLERASDTVAATKLAQHRPRSYNKGTDAPAALGPDQGLPVSELGPNGGIHLPWGVRRLSHRGPVHSALKGLPTVTRDFWLKETTQHQVFAKLYDAGPLDLNTAGPLLQEIDTMVVAGLRALGLDRMPLRKLTLTPM